LQNKWLSNEIVLVTFNDILSYSTIRILPLTYSEKENVSSPKNALLCLFSFDVVKTLFSHVFLGTVTTCGYTITLLQESLAVR
jgi:hypothetical protein